jgi:hypothetical protein
MLRTLSWRRRRIRRRVAWSRRNLQVARRGERRRRCWGAGSCVAITGTRSARDYRASQLLTRETPTTLRAEHRDALRSALRHEVLALEVIADTELPGTFAESLRLRLESDQRLLDDLDAATADDRGMYAFTMPREELERTLTRFHEQAFEELGLLRKELEVYGPTAARGEEAIHRGIDRALALRYACLAALFSLRS